MGVQYERGERRAQGRRKKGFPSEGEEGSLREVSGLRRRD